MLENTGGWAAVVHRYRLGGQPERGQLGPQHLFVGARGLKYVTDTVLRGEWTTRPGRRARR